MTTNPQPAECGVPKAIVTAQAVVMPQTAEAQLPAVVVPIQMAAGHALNPMETLQQLKSIWISQKINIAEVMSGCDMENVYTVYNTERTGEEEVKKDKEAQLFKCKERATCCQRSCVAGSMKEFGMKVEFRSYQFDKEKGGIVPKWIPFLEMNRPYTCTCCNHNRPILSVELVYNGEKKILGYIKNIFKCCDNELIIYKEAESDADFKITSKCCKCGFFCPCGCECCECREVVLDTIDLKTLAKVGEVKKEWTNCEQEVHTNADDYSVKFPDKTTWEQKTMLMAAALFIDYLYFEEKKK